MSVKMCGLLLVLVASAARAEQQVAADQVIDSFEQTFNVHPGHPTDPTDRICAAGEFVGTYAASALSRSRLFAGRPIPVAARFSLAEGNPRDSSASELALEFRLGDGSRQHMTMLNTPRFAAADPITFNEMIGAVKPDPSTGQPDEGRLREFLASHGDAFVRANFLTVAPPSDYANTTFFSVHTFRFIDALGRTHFVRWRFIPRDGEKTLRTSEGPGTRRNAMPEHLIEQLARGPLQWDMIVYVGQPGDTTDNPTIAWPEARKHFKAGTLTITRAIRGSEPACETINSDPLVVADGMAPADDPVLLFRSATYATAFVGYLSKALGLSHAASVVER